MEHKKPLEKIPERLFAECYYYVTD